MRRSRWPEEGIAPTVKVAGGQLPPWPHGRRDSIYRLDGKDGTLGLATPTDETHSWEHMRSHQNRFVVWLLVLSSVCVLANLPRNAGSLKLFLEWAGFPWTFAFWENSELVWFKPGAFAADIGLAVCVTVGLAFLCA